MERQDSGGGGARGMVMVVVVVVVTVTVMRLYCFSPYNHYQTGYLNGLGDHGGRQAVREE